MRVFTLHEPMRNRRDAAFAAAIDAIGDGDGDGPLPVSGRGDEHFVYIPRGVRIIEGSDEAALQALRHFVHPDLEDGESSTNAASRRAIVAPHNVNVDAHNDACA
jgi:hypothetical protein